MSVPFLLALGGEAAENLSIFDPASPSAASIRSLSFLILTISAFIFVIVEGVLLYAVIRFRRKRVPQAGTRKSRNAVLDEAEPPQVYGSTPIEIAWTAA